MTGHPNAIIGGVVPGDPIADVERVLDQQMESSRFRGIRPMGGGMGVPPAEVLRALAERDLIFELMVHPDMLESAATELADFGDLTIVVEHTGWPRSDEPEEASSGRAASLQSPRSATTCTASWGWRCRSTPTRRRCCGRGSSTAWTRSAPSGACSRATSRSTRCTAPSTSSTAPTTVRLRTSTPRRADKLFAGER